MKNGDDDAPNNSLWEQQRIMLYLWGNTSMLS